MPCFCSEISLALPFFPRALGASVTGSDDEEASKQVSWRDVVGATKFVRYGSSHALSPINKTTIGVSDNYESTQTYLLQNQFVTVARFRSFQFAGSRGQVNSNKQSRALQVSLPNLHLLLLQHFITYPTCWGNRTWQWRTP